MTLPLRDSIPVGGLNTGRIKSNPDLVKVPQGHNKYEHISGFSAN
jgi:hypothetical protein